MATYPTTWQAWLDEQDAIPALTDAQVLARLEDWRDECRAMYATEDADWSAVAHLPFGAPARNALADRNLIATHARDRYTAERRAIRVDALRAAGDTRGEFILAMGIGLLPSEGV